MAAIAPIVDSGFLVGLLDRLDGHHEWAAQTARRYAPPWRTCEAVLSETFYVLGSQGKIALTTLVRRDALSFPFAFRKEREPVLALIRKYADVPMSLADACLVRMTEIEPDPLLLTTDADFRIYRRHSRQVIPVAMPD